MNKKMKKLLQKIFIFLGIKIQKYDSAFPELWSSDKDFQSLYTAIENQTVVSQNRCFMLYQIAKYANNKEGEIAEIGVYKGGTAKLIAKTCPNKQVHLFDTFSGMPKVEITIDHHKQGDFSDTSLDAVKAFLSDCNNAIFHPGFFPSTADEVKDKTFSFVYIDVDIYQSIKDCLEFFYGKMIPAGAIIIDDYESKYCPGVKKAVSEFLSDKSEKPIVIAKGQCILLKL